MSPDHPYRVLVVGCGRIAGVFDEENDADRRPLTHAGAYSQNPSFALTACVDPDAKRLSAFTAHWAVENGYVDMRTALESQDFDVISICSPTHAHALDLQTALEASPRLVFCEKPMTTSLDQSEALVHRFKEARIKLMVNYIRRFDPIVHRLRQQIQNGDWGAVRSVHGVYNKGILNNGSHLIDLVQMLLGPLELVDVGAPVDDFFPDDPSVPASFRSAQGVNVFLSCGFAADYALFELAMVTEKGVISMEDGGQNWRTRRVDASQLFSGYKCLNASQFEQGGVDLAMTNAIKQIGSALAGEISLSSDGDNAVAVQRLCEAVARRASEQALRAFHDPKEK